jgi:uncharacterized protein YdhG (YjbR/CyaY superfamily)
MKANPTKFKTVDEYFSTFPASTQTILKTMRKTVKEAAPDAEELISYNMPAYKLNGILVYYAAYKNHIGFYPTSLGIKAFQKELSSYVWAKGSVQFPIDEPLPLTLISKIVKSRVKDNQHEIKPKLKKKK